MADAVAKTSTPDAAAGNPIDITTVTTGAGTVDRQCMSLGDPTTGSSRVAVTAGGAIPVNQGVPASNASAWPVVIAQSGNSSIGSVTVLNFPATQPVSGTVTANQGLPTSNISAWPVFLAQSTNSSIGSVNVLALPALPAGTNSIGTVNAQGMAASGAAVAGNPLLNGLRAATTKPTVVADTQAVAWQGDISGRGIVARSPLALVSRGIVTLTSTATTQLFAATSATSWAIGTIYVSSTTSTVSPRLDFFDNATRILSVQIWAGSPPGGTGPLYFDPPLVCGSGNSVNVALSSAATDVRVTATAYQTNG